MAAVDNAYYEAQRRQINTGSAQELATNAYARFLAQQRGSRERTDLFTNVRQGRNTLNTDIGRYQQDRTRSYQQGYDPYAAQYGARGLVGGGVTSGVQRSGMQDYNQDYRRDTNRAQFDYGRALHRLNRGFRTDLSRSRVNTSEEMNQFDLNQANIQSNKTNALAALQAQRARERAMMAQWLTALQPHLQ